MKNIQESSQYDLLTEKENYVGKIHTSYNRNQIIKLNLRLLGISIEEKRITPNFP
jgi:hypothetical protein